MEMALAKMSPYERGLVDPRPQYGDLQYQPEPGIRVMVFPLVNLLVKPLSWIFDFVESMLLVLIYGIHKVFRWLTTAVIFCLQIWLYGIAESVFKSVLAVVDQVIYSLMPSFMPAILVSDVASVLALTALRAYWYRTSYLGSLKWMVIFRLAIWLFVVVVSLIVPAINLVKTTAPQGVFKGINSRTPWWRTVLSRGHDIEPVSTATPANYASYRIAAPVPEREESRFSGHVMANAKPLPIPAVVPPPPPRRSPSEQPTSRRPQDGLDWFDSASSRHEDGETAEESFYKSLSVVNRRRHAGVKT